MDIIIYLRGDDVQAVVVDLSDAKLGVKPTITRGLHPTLKIRPIHAGGTPFTEAELNYAAWDFVMATDWNTTTTAQIRVQTGIVVTTVAVTVDGVSVNYAEIQIPLTDTNTSELVTAINNTVGVDIGAELAGIPSGESIPGLVWQWDMYVRGRRGTAGTGTPTPVGDGTYSSSQTDALLDAKEVFIAPVAADLTDLGETTVYTVPTGKLFIPDSGRIMCDAITGSGTLPQVKWKAGAVDLMAARRLDADAQYESDMDVLSSDSFFSAGTLIKLEVTEASTYTTHTAKAIIKGVLIDA